MSLLKIHDPVTRNNPQTLSEQFPVGTFYLLYHCTNGNMHLLMDERLAN